MKYGQYWKKEIMDLPETLRKHVINYKAYKKLIKRNASIQDITQKLMEDALNADACFKKTRSIKGLLAFADLNSKSLYKICKKAHKKTRDPNAMKWLQEVHNKHMFSFVSGIKKTKISGNGHLQECPICLDDIVVEDNMAIIMHCGHVMCIKCVKHMLHVDKAKGTIYNLIAYGLYENCKGIATCPLCRDKQAFKDYECVRVPPPQ